MYTAHVYTQWFEELEITLDVSSLGGYFPGPHYLLPPDPSLEPQAARAYSENDCAILAVIHQKIDATERMFIKSCTSALSAISILCARHLDRGPQAQVLLLTELLGTHFSRATSLLDTATAMSDLNSRIWDGAPPTKESILLIATINALCTKFPDLADQFTTLLTKGQLTVELIANRLSAEQLQPDSTFAAPTVLAAQGGPKLKANPFCKEARPVIVCSNKTFCGETGHTIDTCIKPGGGMAGKTLDEAKAAKRAKAGGSGGRSGLNSLSKAYVTLRDSAGNTCYIVDGQLLYPSAAPVPSPSPAIPTTAANLFPQTFVATSDTRAAPVHYSGLSSDSISSVLSPGDQYELQAHVTITDNLRTSLDWSQYWNPIDLANIAVTPTPATGRLPLSHAEYPFLLDSGANASISGERADFATLQPISPVLSVALVERPSVRSVLGLFA